MNNLKTFIALGIILTPVTVSAKSLSAEEAKQIAASFIKNGTDKTSRTITASQNLSLVREGGKMSRSSSSPAYYIFNVSGNNGFVIVSGDDSYSDILGYATDGNYLTDKSNPALDFWLEHITNEMSAISNETGYRPSKTLEGPDVAPLLTTKWGQLEPYNKYCRIPWSLELPPTGCVATAMAQVMNYHKWPQTYSDFEYKWDLMHPTFDGSESEEAIEQVAKLMRHCGYAVNMDYYPSSSSASPFNIVPALVNYFNYDGEQIQMLMRDVYGYERLHEILFNELREGRPFLAGGSYPNSSTGHEFVIDGCNHDGFFHVNWGWDGYLDGYYRITALKPEDFGTGGSLEGYSFDMDIIIGIQPKKSLDETSDLHPKLTAQGDLCLAVYSGGMYIADYENKDTVVSVNSFYSMDLTTRNSRYKGFLNTGHEYFSNALAHTKWTDTSTGESMIIGETFISRDLRPGYYQKSLSIHLVDSKPEQLSQLKEGSIYEVTPVYSFKDSVFIDVEFELGRISKLLAERMGDSIRITIPRKPAILKGEFPSGMGERILTKANQNFEVSFTNTSEEEYLGQVKWKFSDSDGNEVSGLTDYMMLDLLPGEKTTETFTLYNLAKANPGNYHIGLYDFRDNLISELKSVELYEYKLEINPANFPDEVFRNYVAATFDSDGNGYLSQSEIDDVRTMELTNLQVKDLSGIEHFYKLGYFSLSNGLITNLDLSTNPQVYYVDIENTPIESFSTSDNPAISNLRLYNTEVRNLDMTSCPELAYLTVWQNKIESLKVDGLSNLRRLACSSNSIQTLNLNGLENLVYLDCSNNRIKELDISGLEKLITLDAGYNSMTSFRHSSHPALTVLTIEENKLEGKLDLSYFPAIEHLNAVENRFNEIELGNPVNLRALYLTNNELKGKLDLSGCRNLENAFLSDNGFSEILLAEHPELQRLRLANNVIEGCLDLSKCPNIIEIRTPENRLKGIILDNNPELLQLIIYNNNIEGTLDISDSPKLYELYAYHNRISRFIYGDHPELRDIAISNNCLTHFHVEDFPAFSSDSYSSQTAEITVNTPNFNLKTLSSTGFDPKRTSEWWAEWDGKYRECSVINDVVIIPEEAGSNVTLTYKYLTDVTTNRQMNFTILLTREGSSAIEDVRVDNGGITTEGNVINFNADGLKEVFNTAGQCIYRGNDRSIYINAGRGVYLVRMSGTTYKIVI